MTVHIGRKIATAISLESTRGTAETVPQFWLRILAQNHVDKLEYLGSQAAVGSIVENQHMEVDKEWGEGGFDAEIDADSIGLIMLSLMGAVSNSTLDTGIYEHTYDLLEEAEHQALTIFVNEPNAEMAYPLGCLNTLSFSFERGKILDFSANYMSRKGQTMATTPAFAEVKFFRPKDFHFYLADDIAGLAGASETFLKTFSLEFNKNLESNDVLGLDTIENFHNKVFSTTATMNLLYDDDTLRALFKAGTPKAMRIELENASAPLKAGAAAVAATGTVTVVDYTGLTGKTVTVGAVTLTEGVEFNAATGNNETAESLMTAINALPLVNATRTNAVISIVAATPGVAGNALVLSTNGGSDMTVSGAGFLVDGADAIIAINPTLTFDFARVYFSEFVEGNGRDDLKTQEITLTFGIDTEEADIQFGQVRVINETAEYV